MIYTFLFALGKSSFFFSNVLKSHKGITCPQASSFIHFLELSLFDVVVLLLGRRT